MKEKKHIDQLFREGFEGFEATPSPQVWGNIQAQLKQGKEERKVLPLWFRLAGAAAVLALLFTAGNYFFNNTGQDEPIISQEEVVPKTIEKENPVLNNVDDVEIASEDKGIIKKSSDAPLYKNKSVSETVVASQNNTNTKKVQQKTEKSPLIQDPFIESEINKSETAIGHEKVLTEKTDDLQTNQIQKEKTEALIKKESAISETITRDGVAVTEKEDNTTSKTLVEETKKEETTESDKPSILDAINAQKEEAVAVETDTRPDHRWNVTPNFAPVFYNSLKEGSSIDPSFADNEQNSDVNFSYGVQVSYQLNNKISVRSGINNVNVSYGTTGLELGTGPASAALQSIDYSGADGDVIIALDKGSIPAPVNGEFGEIRPKATSGEVELNQKINYYEVPLELNYSLLDTKLGVNLIGGFSTLFLGDNEISVKAGDFENVLGEANNLSSVSFTTNIGVGFNYKFSNKFMFNVEPMFKYQLNPYSDSSVDYKPYYIGIYSGLSFKF